jgi:hypothetical protein
MRSVEILIPASPVPAFFSQIAAFSWALQRLRWSRWRPRLRVAMGGDVDTAALERWLPFLSDVEIVLLRRSQSLREGIWAQYDSLYQMASSDADVVLRMDADTLPIGDFEDVLDRVVETGCVAGVIEHHPFSKPVGLARSEDWQRLAAEFIGRPIDLAFRYTLLPNPEWPAPFYLNDGAVFCSEKIFPELSRAYLRLRPQLMHRLGQSYFAGQVGFALAVAEVGAPSWALPIRYNFPNDQRAVSLHEDELARVTIFHYLRTEKYDRHKIFRSAAEYDSFINLPLTGVDAVFQQKVREIFGSDYPFEAPELAARATVRGSPRRGEDPLSDAAFEHEIAEHDAGVAAELIGLDREIAASRPRAKAELALPLTTLAYADQFESSGHLEPLMRFKRELVNAFGVEDGFRVYRERLKLPDSGRIRLDRLESLYSFAKTCGEPFIEIDPGGERFVVPAPTVIGEGVCRPLEHVSRPLYVACLGAARVRGRSAVIEIEGLGLLDYLDWERDLFDCELEIDPAIFHASRDAAWIIGPQDDGPSIDLDEAFTLLGPDSGAFGDWMVQFLPRYVAADMSGQLPPVPVLVDARMPPSIYRCIEVMVPRGVEIIRIPTYATARVRRLWCASNLQYAPTFEKMDGRFRWDYLASPPATARSVVRETRRRADAAIAGGASGPERVFLGRRPRLWRKLVNYAAIEAVAEARGFQVVYPEDLSFDDQVRLLRGARFVIAPEGSALFLLYFSEPGTKLCILNDTMTEGSLGYNGSFDGVDVTLFTGPIVGLDADFEERSDYAIDENRFATFVESWL